MRATWIVAASFAAIAGLPAQGFRGGGSSADVWAYLQKTYDKDRDGVITKQEYARGDDKFARYDRDGSGELTKDDFPAGNRGRRGGGQRGGGQRGGFGGRNMGRMIAGRIVRAADADENGEVTKKEFEDHVCKLETDANGVLSDKALDALMPRMRGGGRQRGGGGASRMVEMLKSSLDKDADGAVELADLEALFGELDADKNDVVAGAELGQRGGNRQRGGGNRQRGGDPRGRSRSRGRDQNVPQPGQVAPDFELVYAKDKTKTAKLSSFAGDKPVALIFGSYT